MSTKKLSIKRFQNLILEWYKDNGRHGLPWRQTRDPYRIMVSEIMLQQTQVDRVIEKYKEFLRAFPTAQKLAKASVYDLLRVWKGLGYNRRALNLQRAAQKILSDYDDLFPENITDIQKLPGVGPYTARAIATFAFEQPHIFIETNIRRIFIHFFFPDQEGVSDDNLAPLVKKALLKKDPYTWYSALMDYGALAMKDISNPNKKSKNYTRQSRFEGSRRYARAKILTFLVETHSASQQQFQKYFQSDPHLEPFSSKYTLHSILYDLTREGFLTKKSNRWSLSGM